MISCKTLKEVTHGLVTNFPLYVWWSEPQGDTLIHRHSFTELVLILKGKADHCIDGVTSPVTTGDIVVIPPEVYHFFKNSTPDFSLVNIIFVTDELPMPQLDIHRLPGFHAIFHCRKTEGGKYPSLHLKDKDFQRIRQLAERLRDLDSERSSGYRFEMLATFMLLLSELAHLFSGDDSQMSQKHLRINGAISHINRHFREKCSLATLCHIARMSKSTLQRNFLNATGNSPRQYQLQLRITEATLLLRTTTKSIDEIALELGFSDRNYFSRQFQRITGNSPGKFRREGR